MSIIPLLGWYDYSFGEPSEELKSTWMDYRMCRWSSGLTEKDIVAYFTAFNNCRTWSTAETVITYSHFLPRIDLMPSYVPRAARLLYPILGSDQLELDLHQKFMCTATVTLTVRQQLEEYRTSIMRLAIPPKRGSRPSA